MKIIATYMIVLVGLTVTATATNAGQQLPPGGSWQAVALTCNIAGGSLCADRAAGGFEMLMETHQICADHVLLPKEVWAVVNSYFAEHPDRRRQGGLSGWVYEAAIAKYPCTAHN